MSIFDTIQSGLKGNISDGLLEKGLSLATSAEQITKLLDNDLVQTLAAKFSIPVATIQAKLPILLPEITTAFLTEGKLDATKLNKEALIGVISNLLKN